MTAEIHSTLVQLQEQDEAIHIQMKIVDPFNEEQKKFYSKISRSVAKVCMTIKESLKMMEKEEKKEKIMNHEHEENRELVALIKSMNAENDLVHLAK